jgi:ankyrin repeat protein
VLVEGGAETNARERTHGQTALMWALSEQHWDAARTLVRNGADVRARSEGGFTPLMFTARFGNIDTARLLLESGADVNAAAANGVTSLLTAAVRGHVALATFLLDRGADPNADAAGYTALHWAAGSWETEVTGEFGITADASEWRSMAGLRGEAKLDLVKALLARGANPNARTTRNVQRFGFSGSSNTPQFYLTVGATPFLLAAQAGDARMMKLLADAGSNPTLPTNANSTPLMQAAGIARVIGESHVTEQQALEAVTLALALGGDVNAADSRGDTALHASASQGMDTVVQFLVDKGARLDARNEAGETPWIIAAGRGIRRGATNISHPRTAELLRRLGATTEP